MRFLFKIFSAKSGELMLESMIAITVAIFGLLGLLSLLSQALGLTRVITDQYIGSYLASEGIEIVKNLIDNNVRRSLSWNQGFAEERCYEVDYLIFDISAAPQVPCPDGSGTFLEFDEQEGVYSYSGTEQTRFQRTIHITPLGSDEIKVNSFVEWTTRGGGEFFVNAENHFYNWRP